MYYRIYYPLVLFLLLNFSFLTNYAILIVILVLLKYIKSNNIIFILYLISCFTFIFCVTLFCRALKTVFEKFTSLPSILDFFNLNNFLVEDLIKFLRRANLPDLAALLENITTQLAEALAITDFGHLEKLLPSKLRRLYRNIFDDFPKFNTPDNLVYFLQSG